MNTATKLTAFVLVVGGVFAGAYGVGQAVGPLEAEPVVNHDAAAGHTGTAGGHDAAGGHSATAAVMGGTQVSDKGLTFKVVTNETVAGVANDFTFQILSRSGEPLRQFRPQHDKLMHLIVARRDLSNFQHVHPTMDADGTWHVPLTFAGAGEYRAFADFAPEVLNGETLALGADVSVSGEFAPTPLPAPSATATVDGYTVTLKGGMSPGESTKLILSVSKDGVPVTTLEPYLAAYGHLVALRDGDMAYLHVHPDGAPGDGKTQPGPDIVFYATAPSAGTYRLFLDFKIGDVVRTAEFTARATGVNPDPNAAPGISADGHDHSKDGG